MLKKLLGLWGTLSVFAVTMLVYFVANIMFVMQQLFKLPGIEHVALKKGSFILNHGERTISIFDMPFMGVGAILGAIIGALIILGASRSISRHPFKYLGLDHISFKNSAGFVIAFIILVVLSPFIERLFPALESEEMNRMIALGMQTPIITIFAVGIAAPFLEELVFRGWLFKRLEELFSGPVALVATSIMFTLIHVQYQWPILLVLLIMSFILGIVRWRTGSLWPSVLLHCGNNTTMALIVYWTTTQ